jgi:hypothetical protein
LRVNFQHLLLYLRLNHDHRLVPLRLRHSGESGGRRRSLGSSCPPRCSAMHAEWGDLELMSKTNFSKICRIVLMARNRTNSTTGLRPRIHRLPSQASNPRPTTSDQLKSSNQIARPLKRKQNTPRSAAGEGSPRARQRTTAPRVRSSDQVPLNTSSSSP